MNLPVKPLLAVVLALILVPDDLASFEAVLDAPTLDALVAGLASTQVRLRVPNWEDDVTLPLSELLAPLGLPANLWNFGRMVAEPGLADIGVLTLQRARIEVDKDGTRAAAVTIGVGATSAPAEPMVFDVDRPFVYVLRDRATGTLLFTGRVVAPG